MTPNRLAVLGLLATVASSSWLTACGAPKPHHAVSRRTSSPSRSPAHDAAPSTPSTASSSPAPTSAIPDRRRPTVPSVGPLFSAGLSAPHGCTAAVVDTPARNVIVTAAHCVVGSGTGLVFAPGYDEGTAPYGTWVVQRAYLPRNWVASGDPDLDYAFLVVAPSSTNARSLPVQAVVGGNLLGHTPATDQRVTVVGYVAGIDDDPVICSAKVYRTRGYPSVDCPGYASGTSGGPWLADYDPATRTGTISAVIGGPDHGGCTDDTSYSSTFGAAVQALLRRTLSGAAADVGGPPLPNGC